jgi:hypothetical protein
MAMGTALVAAVAQVDLQCGQISPLQWWKQCRANGQWSFTPKDLIFLDRGRPWGTLSG